MRVFALGLILSLAACSAFTEDTENGPKAERLAFGKEAFRDNCAACHGMDGHGSGPAAGAMKAGTPDLTQLAVKNHNVYPRDYVIYVMDGRVEIMSHGTREMPLWGTQLGDPEADALLFGIVDYIESLQRPAG